MISNIVVGIFFAALAVVLFLISERGLITNEWLDKADKIASVVALVIAIIAFINPFSGKEAASPNIAIGDHSDGNTVGATAKGDVYIGDTTTSAEHRYQNAFRQVKDEILQNVQSLGLLVETIENQPPEQFWDIRRANETEPAYQDRALIEFRSYQAAIKLFVDQTRFSKSTRDFQKENLSHNTEKTIEIDNVYAQLHESWDSFERYLSGLQHITSLGLSDIERSAKALSLHSEKVLNAKFALFYASAIFFDLANPSERTLLNDSLKVVSDDLNNIATSSGRAELMIIAQGFAEKKAQVMADRITANTSASKREVDRRISDPYLLMLRGSTGLEETLSEGELHALQSKEIDVDEGDPSKLFQLAAFSYLESDGHASLFYFDKAIQTGALSELQQKFAEVSIDRIKSPEKYDGSIGLFVVKISEGGNFDKAGIKAGDVVTLINEEKVVEPYNIASILATSQNQPVLLSIVRGGEKSILKVNGGESAGAIVSQLIVLQGVQL